MSNEIYFSDSNRDLFKYNLNLSGDSDYISNLSVQLTDIAMAPDGEIYGISFTHFYHLEKSTGQLSLIRSLGLSFANAFTFDPYGNAYVASDTSSGLHSLNVKTGQTTLIGNNQFGPQSAGDFAIQDGDLWWSTKDQTLSKVDPATGLILEEITHGIDSIFGLASTGARFVALAGDSVYDIDVVG